MELTRAARIAQKAARNAQKAADRGRHIFIYNNIRTNQTVYSLQRSLDNHHALSQLAYAGKKTLPANLRKDVWRPMAIVTFLNPTQGLAMYQKLREFRKLHELHWANNKEYPMLPPETQTKIKEGKAAPSKKDRAKIIMDQKANTIADLAALLKKYDEESRMQLLRTKVREMEAAAEAERAARSTRLKEIEEEMAKKQLAMDDPTLNGSTRKPILVLYKGLKREKQSLLAAEAELEKKMGVVTDMELVDEAANGGLYQNMKKIREADKTLAMKDDLSPEKRARLEERIEEARNKQKEMRRAIESLKKEHETVNEHRAGRKLLKKVGEDGQGLWWAQDVSIRWADKLDVGYAKEWPAKVVHETFGWMRHSAPDPNAFAQEDVFDDEMEEYDEMEEAAEGETEGKTDKAAESKTA